MFDFMKITVCIITIRNISQKQDHNIAHQQNVKLIMDANDLNGTHRFVLDGLSNDKECQALLKIANVYAQSGDGYNGEKSPHTKMETFIGLTVSRATLLVYLAIMAPQALQLFLATTEAARLQVIEHFGLKHKLYFNFTHLVCRTPTDDAPLNRSDYSHTIHADNCNLKENGFCEKIRPAFTWRDYSAVVYLNSNFQGGEFIFSADANGAHIQASVKPKCGRMVGFSAGPENLHGVRAVRRGTRCALAMWFTFNKKYEETSRNTAYKLIGLDEQKYN